MDSKTTVICPSVEQLDREILASLIERARDAAISRPRHQPESIPTVAAYILFDMLAADIRRFGACCQSGTTTAQLRKDVTKHRLWADSESGAKSLMHAVSFKNVPRDIGRSLTNWNYLGEHNGRTWLLGFTGPLATQRDRATEDSRLFLTVSYQPIDAGVKAVDPPRGQTVLFPDVIGVCFACRHPVTQFDVNGRVCSGPKCPWHPPEIAGTPGDDRFVDVLPEPVVGATAKSQPFPIFVTIGNGKDGPPRRNETVGADEPISRFPYEHDYLLDCGLHLGSPLVYRAPALETGSFGSVSIFDMSTYSISNTLKDPKSWAVVNTAIHCDVNDLVVYTAGNAGVSLAKLVSQANLRMRGELKVHALVDRNVPTAIRQVMRGWGAEVEEVPTDSEDFLTPAQVWHAFNAKKRRVSDLPAVGAWHVSEGWDGIGSLVYRTIFAELLSRVHIDYLIVPVGQGSLFLGAYQAMKDAKSTHTHLVGAVPLGLNVLSSCMDPARLEGDVPRAEYALAPKLSGKYSPLARCICHLQNDANVTFIEVSHMMQWSAAARGEMRQMVATEPSALIAFGALQGKDKRMGLLEKVRSIRRVSDLSVVIVNSGMGICDDSEAEFISKVP